MSSFSLSEKGGNFEKQDLRQAEHYHEGLDFQGDDCLLTFFWRFFSPTKKVDFPRHPFCIPDRIMHEFKDSVATASITAASY